MGDALRKLASLAALTLALAPIGAARADSNLGGGLLQWLAQVGHAPAPSAVPLAAFMEPPPAPLASEPAAPGSKAKVILAAIPPADPFAQPQAAPAEALQHAVPPEFQRQEVAYAEGEKPGTIIIDTKQRFLFYVLPGGRAVRYGVGVGRPGFEWAGVKTISRKAQWPDWTPPVEMMLRRPDIPDHMNGGPENPLGARALYLGSSLYRIHGTNEPWTIGQNVSSGCIRMMNEDVIDLYDRARVGTKVIVI